MSLVPNTLIAEQELLAQAKTDAEGFARLFDRYYQPLLNYAWRRTGNLQTAQDIIAAVFEDALKQIQTVEWRGTPLSAWLYRLAANKVADYFRAYYRRQDLGLDSARRFPANTPAPDSALLQAEQIAVLNQALHQLSEADQLALNLIYFDELSREEAAIILDCKVDNVYVKLHRALARLKIQFVKLEESDDKQ